MWAMNVHVKPYFQFHLVVFFHQAITEGTSFVTFVCVRACVFLVKTFSLSELHSDLIYSNNGHSNLVNVTRLLKLHRNHYLPRASKLSKGQPLLTCYLFHNLHVNKPTWKK